MFSIVCSKKIYQSVLDEAVLLPERTLLWHYRSRHEHLIAFSNARIYQNRLVTFPSNVEKKADIGVEYIYVPEGRYDRGGKKGNAREAAKVASLVFEHFRKFPDRSLGVITFGEVQQQAIDAAIRERRLEEPDFEPFFNEERQEPFFIKSLENVQGQVGCFGYRIDIAVKHPVLCGQYVMGIECDVVSYHSSRTARERDRLRRDMLETMGWNLYHIWSVDWVKDPVAEGQRLIDAIEAVLFDLVDD